MQRIDESFAEAGIDFDPGFSPPSSGTYFLYITGIRPDVVEWPMTEKLGLELRYMSIDATSRGRILSVQTQPDLLVVSNDLQTPRLLMAWFDEQGASIREVNLIDRTLRMWQAAAPCDFCQEPGIQLDEVEISTEPKRPFAPHAFSPDGRWLVWDCKLGGGTAAWCLLDLRRGTAQSVKPCGERLAEQGHAGHFNWSPASDRFLALQVCSPDAEYTVFLASLGNRTVAEFQWPPEYGAILSQQEFGRNLPSDYLWSPKGDQLLSMWVGDLEVGEGAIYVASVDCIFGGPCDATSLVRWPYDWRGIFTTTFLWSPTGGEIGLAEQPEAVPGPGPIPRTAIGMIDLNSAKTRFLNHFGPAAAELEGWSPDGRWMLMISLGVSKYTLYGLSTDGILRGLVAPGDGGFGFIGFAGWWVIP